MDQNTIEAVFPLSPVQDDSVQDGERSPLGTCGQLRCEIRGELDLEVLEKAWQSVVVRHPALRTVLVRKGLKSPVQIVYRRTKAVVANRLPPAAGDANRDEVVRSILREQEEMGFALFEQILVRPVVYRLPDGSHELVCSYHRAALDEASVALVARDLFAAYVRIARGETSVAV